MARYLFLVLVVSGCGAAPKGVVGSCGSPAEGACIDFVDKTPAAPPLETLDLKYMCDAYVGLKPNPDPVACAPKGAVGKCHTITLDGVEQIIWFYPPFTAETVGEFCSGKNLQQDPL